MSATVLKCPQCNGLLSPSRFARSVVCSFCGSTVMLDEASVEAARLRAAHRVWNDPASHGIASWVELAGARWTVDTLLARGEVADVYLARRARWPTELTLVKVLRTSADCARFDNAWRVVATLLASHLPAAATLGTRLPQPIARGRIGAGAWSGAEIAVLRRPLGFDRTAVQVRAEHPAGIEPRASIWVWRRLLELLAFLHAADYVHAAVVPEHLLIETGEHGAQLVGFGRCRPAGSQPDASPLPAGLAAPSITAGEPLAPAVDLVMSARTIAGLLGGDAATGELPAVVPAELADLLRRVGNPARRDPPLPAAWELRQALGELAQRTFGPPAFCPI